MYRAGAPRDVTRLEGHLHLDVTALVHAVHVLEAGGGRRLQHTVRVPPVDESADGRGLSAVSVQGDRLGRAVTPVDPADEIVIIIPTESS